MTKEKKIVEKRRKDEKKTSPEMGLELTTFTSEVSEAERSIITAIEPAHIQFHFKSVYKVIVLLGAQENVKQLKVQSHFRIFSRKVKMKHIIFRFENASNNFLQFFEFFQIFLID